ncbi:unnamed protein product [Allacma fusca]|uniref:Uncharacterized protein n=1 Tax=Allacma fusca TaxID=39272 RepID=A0A8J2LC22_9HEXA|nr:unnamed protein product [Allacma fusca]
MNTEDLIFLTIIIHSSTTSPCSSSIHTKILRTGFPHVDCHDCGGSEEGADAGMGLTQIFGGQDGNREGMDFFNAGGGRL